MKCILPPLRIVENSQMTNSTYDVGKYYYHLAKIYEEISSHDRSALSGYSGKQGKGTHRMEKSHYRERVQG